MVTNETLQAVCNALGKLNQTDTCSVEYPGYILLTIHGMDLNEIHIGTVNGTWEFDLIENDRTLETVDTGIPADETNVDIIVNALVDKLTVHEYMQQGFYPNV